MAMPVPASYSVDLARGSAGPWSVMNTTQVVRSKPVAAKRVEQLPDGGVGDGDRAVELGQVLADFVGLGQIVGHRDGGPVRGLVAVARVGAVGLEEARGQQERLARRIGKPSCRAVDHVFAVGIRDVELVEAEPGWIRGFVLHTEKCCVPTCFG